MSRRRTTKSTANTKAPNDGTAWGHLSDADLLKQVAAELARRRVARGALDLDAIESFSEGSQQDFGQETLSATVAALGPEDSSPKPCPKCGVPVPVKTHNRVRHVLTLAGEFRLSRNYHYCRRCSAGFYPRDLELKLPAEGEVSDAMERRILDFGINDTFESSAERWSIHYRHSISSNLVRRVVDRVGVRCEAARELALQRACNPAPAEPVPALVVASDGSMLLTREDAWREAKVAVVAHLTPGRDGAPHEVSSPRFAAILGGKVEFSSAVAAALAAERADEVPLVAWLGDGAPSNWTLASELCPFAIQILDVIHALQHGNDCGKALLGEGDAALPLWAARIEQLLAASNVDLLVRELLDCLPFTTTDAHLGALDDLIGYYRTNEHRMQYRRFRELGLPIGSGIVESAHRHVLQARMKRAGQRWGLVRGRRMARLRAAYRTAGPRRFHRALREAHFVQARPPPQRPLPNGPRRVNRTYTLGRGSPINRRNASI